MRRNCSLPRSPHLLRKWSIVPLSLLSCLLALAMLLAACGSQAATAGSTASGATTTAGVTTAAGGQTDQAFTAAELAAFDGKNGNKAYIAVDGIVYDVTKVAEWASRLHAGRFAPGKDYSAEIKKAPHGVEQLLKAVRVGIFKG